MSKENRMLVMFFAGMVLLFTYFRFQYPNIGGGENLRRNPQAPMIRVLSESELMPGVEKVARSYELEFGVRVILESSENVSDANSDYDLLVESGDGMFGRNTGVVHHFSIPPWHPEEGESVDTSWRIGVRSVSHIRQIGAAKFARYLTANDRGLRLVSPDIELKQSADLWMTEPMPTLVIWDAVFPFVQSVVGEFEKLEGASIRLVVADCPLVSAKLSKNKEADGVLVLGTGCTGDGTNDGWDPLSMGTRSIVMLTSSQHPDGGDVDQWFAKENVSVGSLGGLYSLLLEAVNEGPFPVGLRDFLTNSTPKNYSRLRDLLGGIARNPDMIGLTIELPSADLGDGIRVRAIGGSEAGIPLSLWVSENSSYKHLLSRLAQLIASEHRVHP
jgi:hypothetical protein